MFEKTPQDRLATETFKNETTTLVNASVRYSLILG